MELDEVARWAVAVAVATRGVASGSVEARGSEVRPQRAYLRINIIKMGGYINEVPMAKFSDFFSKGVGDWSLRSMRILKLFIFIELDNLFTVLKVMPNLNKSTGTNNFKNQFSF